MKAGTFPGHLRPNRGWCQHSEEGSERRHQENLREAEQEPSGPAPGVPPPKDSHHLWWHILLLKLIQAGFVLLLAANDIPPSATFSYDDMTLNFTVFLNKSQCLIHTVGSEFERKLSCNLWQQHTFFKSQFAIKFRCLDGTIKSLTWK